MLGFSYVPTPDSEPEITQVVLNGAMMEAGVQAGDIIREIKDVYKRQAYHRYAYYDFLDGSDCCHWIFGVFYGTAKWCGTY